MLKLYRNTKQQQTDWIAQTDMHEDEVRPRPYAKLIRIGVDDIIFCLLHFDERSILSTRYDFLLP